MAVSRNEPGQPDDDSPVELAPEKVEYVGPNEVLVSMKTKTGDITTFSLKTAMLVHMVNLSVALINGYTAQVFRDLDVL